MTQWRLSLTPQWHKASSLYLERIHPLGVTPCIIPKPWGICITIDLSKLNSQISRPTHPSPAPFTATWSVIHPCGCWDHLLHQEHCQRRSKGDPCWHTIWQWPTIRGTLSCVYGWCCLHQITSTCPEWVPMRLLGLTQHPASILKTTGLSLLQRGPHPLWHLGVCSCCTSSACFGPPTQQPPRSRSYQMSSTAGCILAQYQCGHSKHSPHLWTKPVDVTESAESLRNCNKKKLWAGVSHLLFYCREVLTHHPWQIFWVACGGVLWLQHNVLSHHKPLQEVIPRHGCPI